MSNEFERDWNEGSTALMTNTSRGGFVRRTLVGVGITVAVLLLLLLLWYAVGVLLLTFAAILLAILLRGLSAKLGERTGLFPAVGRSQSCCSRPSPSSASRCGGYRLRSPSKRTNSRKRRRAL